MSRQLVNSLLTIILTLISLQLAQCQSDIDTFLDKCLSGEIGCFRAPADCARWSGTAPRGDCKAAVAYSSVSDVSGADWVELQLVAKWEGDEGAIRYVAVGFSYDDDMSDDAVTACVLNTATSGTEPYLSYNVKDGKNSEKLSFQTATSNVELISSTSKDGYYYCKVKQRVVPKAVDKVFPLNKPYFLLLAVGPVSSSGLGYHKYKAASGAKVDVSTAAGSAVGGKSAARENLEHALKRTHGCLMLFAWWLFSALAILMAGYYKPAWRGKTIFGIPIWFQIHRGFNTFAVFLIVLAVIAILIAEGVELNGRHQIVGLIGIILGWFNPINALFRCHPGTDNRWIFNLVHRLCGGVAWVLASTAIFLTIWEFTDIWKDWTFALIVMIVFVVCLLVTMFILEMLRIAARKKRISSVGADNAGDLQMRDVRNGSRPQTTEDDSNVHQSDGARTAVFGLMALVAFVAVIILVVLLATS